jgi:fructuronate reductase
MKKIDDIQSLKNKSTIVHIGLGAFHRAHQALYTSELIDQTDANWRICSINLFGEPNLIHDLKKQNNQYAVLERGTTRNHLKISKSITECLHPDVDGQQTILNKMASPDVAIVSLTITEKGYCISPSTGDIDLNNALIKEDLLQPNKPRSAIGYIVEALRIRKERQLPPFTVLSCDNIQGNGNVAKHAILSFSKLVNSDLHHWISENVTFPNTMVDRIVPAVTPETLSNIESVLGYYDPCAIACEPFRQWFIEDDFVCGRPDWNVVGANFVHDVIPFEEMKLRMLNGSHSFLAYLGYLIGYKTIDDAIADPYLNKATLSLMLQEQAPSLTLPEGIDVNTYAHSLINRFSNPNLKHLLRQIATDGSQKLPPRFCNSLRFNRRHGFPTKWLSLGIASWMSYVTHDEIDVNDPLKNVFEKIKSKKQSNADRVMALLNIDSIFESDLIADHELVKNIQETFDNIQNLGAQKTLYSMLANEKEIMSHEL